MDRQIDDLIAAVEVFVNNEFTSGLRMSHREQQFLARFSTL